MEYCDAITLLPLLGMNNRLPLLHMSKIFVYINTTYELINTGPGIRLDNLQVPDWCGLRLFKIGSCDPLDFSAYSNPQSVGQGDPIRL